MEVIGNNNNSPSFKAKIVFMDRGKCFSRRQKSYLKALAKNIGDSDDRFYIGTRKYKYISVVDYKTRFQCKDMQVLSDVNGVSHDYRCIHRDIQDEIENETSQYFYDLPKKERWKRFNEKMYDSIRGFLETFNESVSKESSRSRGRTQSETREIFKKEVSDFSKLKRIYPKMGFKKWLKSLLFNDEYAIPHIEECKPLRKPAPTKSNMQETPASKSRENDSIERVPIGQAVYEEFLKPAKDIFSNIFRVD